jgi:hypothetical protein
MSRDKTSEIIDSQVNGQDGRSTDARMRFMPEEEYLPHCEGVLMI